MSDIIKEKWDIERCVTEKHMLKTKEKKSLFILQIENNLLILFQ